VNYINFDILIQNEANGRYPLIVLPYVMGAQDYLSGELLNEVTLEDLKRCDEDCTDNDLILRIGKHLHNCLFQGNVRVRFQELFDKVKADPAMGVRIRLMIEPPVIAAIPWELLYDSERGVFLATWIKTPVTRFLKMFSSDYSLTVIPPVNVLVAIPSSSGLDIEGEKSVMRAAFASLERDGVVKLDFLEEKVSIQSIAEKFSAKKYHVFHFIGHGCFQEGKQDGFLGINWDDDDEKTVFPGVRPELEGLKWLEATEVANLFLNHPSIKLIVLNSCQGAQVSTTKPFAGLVPRLGLREVPAVVAMQYPIYDKAAKVFSAWFYKTLCTGYERGLLDVAVSTARHQMLFGRRGHVDFATPVLFMLTDNGVIFDLKDPRDPTLSTISTAEPPGGAEPTDDEIVGGSTGSPSPPGLTDRGSAIWRGVTAPFRTVNESSRWQAVNEARKKHREVIEQKIAETKEPEQLGNLKQALAVESQEIAVLQNRLSGVVKASLQITALSFAVSLLLFAFSFYGLRDLFLPGFVLNLFGVENFTERVFSAFRPADPSVFGNDQIRLVLVDETSLSEKKFPHADRINDRQNHAELIEALTRGGAKVVALDVFMIDPSDWDARLADDIRNAEQKGTHVIVGVEGVNSEGNPIHEFPPLLSSTLQDKWGNVVAANEQAGFRRVVQGVYLGDEISSGPRLKKTDHGVSIAPSFPLQVVREFKRNGAAPESFMNSREKSIQLVNADDRVEMAIPVDNDEMNFNLTYPGDETLTKIRHTYQEVLQRQNDESFLRQTFGERIVIVGYQQSDLHLISGTGRELPGPAIHAVAVANMLQGIYRKKLGMTYELSIAIALFLLGGAAQLAGRQVRFEVPFKTPALRKAIRIPVLLIVVTLLYLGAMLLVYSSTPYVPNVSSHLLALFLGYWITASDVGKALSVALLSKVEETKEDEKTKIAI